MTQPAKAQEPSMEEILASIRRIIADDENKPASTSAAAAPAPSKAAAPPPVKSAPPAATPAPPSPGAAAKPAPSPAAASPVVAKPAPAANPAPVAKAAAPSAAPAANPNNQDDIDALLADFEADNTSGDMKSDAAEAEEEILDLTESMTVSKEPSFQTIEPEDDLEFSEDDNAMAAAMAVPTPVAPRAEIETRPPAVSFEASAAPAVPERPLLSATTISAVDSAFNTLAHTVLSQNARTLEDLVREMLRPMLKSWLDDNLPGLVERLVKAEIERVARGR